MTYRKKSAFQLTSRIVRGIRLHPRAGASFTRSLCRALYWQLPKRISDEPEEKTTDYGIIRCYSDSNSASNLFYFTDYFDVDEMGFCRRYLRPGDYVVDAGANIGIYTVFLHHVIEPGGRVDVIEPAPQAVNRIHENVRLNNAENAVEVYPCALARASGGTVDFLADQDVTNRVASRKWEGRRYVQVQTLALDDVLQGRPAALVKLDVEGSEYESLLGASKSLERGVPSVLLIELLQNMLRRQGSSVEAVVGLLKSYGFAFWTWSEARREAPRRFTWVAQIRVFQPTGRPW